MSFIKRVSSISLAVVLLIAPVAANLQQSDAGAALREGRRLLKRGQADKALIQLRNALNLYTAAKNKSGMAATHNELGDLYMRQGQYQVALDNYQKALEGFIEGDKKEAVNTAAVSAVAPGAAPLATIADDKYNANLMLAKIGDVNFRLGKTADARAAYSRMVVKKPEGAAAKAGRRFGGFGAIVGGISTGRVSVAAPTSTVTSLLEAKKELDEYRVSIVYSSYELGMGRLAYAENDLEGAKKHFQNALDAAGSSIAGIAKLGQVRRFRAASRTSLGDIALRQGKFKDATKFYNDAKKGAQDDKRLDLMWPAQRGLGRSLWLQAAQEKDPKKALPLRESAVANYRESLTTIETLRQGSLRADESRTTFLASIKDVFDEAAGAYASLALIASTDAGAPLSGKALEYASEAFRINEQSRARSLLDLLAETDAAITEGVPAELLKRKQENLDRQQDIADILTGINVSTEELKKKPAELDEELEKLQTEYEEIENQIRTASPRYATLTANKPLTLAEVQQNVLDDKTALVEYALQGDESYLFVATKSGVSLFKLPGRASIEKLAMDLRAQLIPSKLQRRIVGIDVAEANRGLGVASSAPEDVAPFVAASNALYKVVLEPAAGMIGDKRLMIVADGALNYIPFEALLKTADSGDFSSLGYLIKSNEIIYAPSASVVGAIKQQRAKATGRAILVIADPVFNSNDARAQKRTGTPASDAEVRGLGIQGALADVAGSNARRVQCCNGRFTALPAQRHAHRSRGNLEARQSLRRPGRRLAGPRRKRRQSRHARHQQVPDHSRRDARLAECRTPAVYRRRALTRRQQDTRRLCSHRRSLQPSPRLASRHAFGMRDRSRQREARRRRHGPYARIHVRRCADRRRQSLVSGGQVHCRLDDRLLQTPFEHWRRHHLLERAAWRAVSDDLR